jgi:L-fuculose-phosphate aldolase
MDELTQLKAALVAAGQRIIARGLVAMTGGNLSARVPGADAIMITPTGYDLAEFKESDLVTVDLDGNPIAGDLKPSSELPMHLATYRVRPDAQVIFHLHPFFSNLMAALDEPIHLMTVDPAYYLLDIAYTEFELSGTKELAEVAAQAARQVNVVLLKHHGCMIVADSVKLALVRAENLEVAARMTYYAKLLGKTADVPEIYMERARRLQGH